MRRVESENLNYRNYFVEGLYIEVSMRGLEEFQPILRMIRAYRREELIYELLILSLHVSRSQLNAWKKGYVPWEIMLLARMVLFDWKNIDGDEEVNILAINKILMAIKDFSNDSGLNFLNGEGKGIFKFMRRMSFQQMWGQKSLCSSTLARASELLVNSKMDAHFSKSLVRVCGVERNEFQDIVFTIWTLFSCTPIEYVKVETFSKLFVEIERIKIEKFLEYFSLELDKIDYFFEDFPIRNISNDMFDHSPFVFKPFIKLGDYYFLWDINLIQELVEFGIYDVLKLECKGGFTRDFGLNAFENYITSRLLNYRISFLDENDLKKKGYEKQVDFLLTGLDYSLSIEAKGIEASTSVKVFPTDEVLMNQYKGNIVKSIIQGNYVAKKSEKERKYLITVTYKELYLGDSENAWDEFIGETLSKKYSFDDIVIPKSNVFFVSIEDFDKLLILANGKVEEIVNILDKVIALKKDPASRKWIFAQYLEAIFQGERIVYKDNFLREKYESYFSTYMRKYFKNEI